MRGYGAEAGAKVDKAVRFLLFPATSSPRSSKFSISWEQHYQLQPILRLNANSSLAVERG